MPTGQCLVIGIGNADRGDDAVGRVVARKLSTRRIPGVRVLEQGGEAAGLLDGLSGAQAAYLIDAARSGRLPGTISRFDAAAMELPRIAFGCSTHGLGLAEAIELARALGQLPHRCVVYAIEGRAYDIGAPLSPEVATAAEAVARMIADEMRGFVRDEGAG
ncbi:MAG TPA: hydrogenase maturation protease [Xanthobacteraceae bacterium]|nr:hydrogenase maturation protease [Xanthobacteraceae bacterium]